MVVRPPETVNDCQQPLRANSVTNRTKRASLNSDASTRKRRKVDQIRVSQSPSVHTTTSKQFQIICSSPNVPGIALFLGVGDTGQLGLGPDITERSRPARLNAVSLKSLSIDEEESESHFMQICAGGMHSVCLTSDGLVATCGCNDEGALGRPLASDEDGDSIMDEDSPKSNKRLCVDSKEASKDLDLPIVNETRLGLVPFPIKIKVTMVSAGDSHTAALDSNGQVWLWGTFRGSSGPIGLTQPGEISTTPRPLLPYSKDCTNGSSDGLTTAAEPKPALTTNRTNTAHLTLGAQVIKIASGQDHLVCLTDDGRLYTMGCAEQGQLGRIAERFAKDGGRSGIISLLQPTECRLRGSVRFSDTWAGGFATFARCQTSGAIYACGLNNYGQLALLNQSIQDGISQSLASNTEELVEDEEMPDDASKLVTDRDEASKSEAKLIAKQGPLIQFMLVRAFGFDPALNWTRFAVSMHHTLALDGQGHVYAVGRADYGRLGLGNSTGPKVTVSSPTRVLGCLQDVSCSWIGCGESCSFAVDTKGTAYSWGMGSNKQLGHGDDDDDSWEPSPMQGKQLEDRRVLMVDAGGQHTVILARSTKLDLEQPASLDVPMTDAISNDTNCLSSPVVAKALNHEQYVIHNHDSNLDSTKGQTNGLTASDLTNDSLISDKSCKFPNDLIERKIEFSDNDPGLATEPIIIAPVGVVSLQSRRNRRVSPSSVSGGTLTTVIASVGLSCESTTGSTAGATMNSSVHSSAISDTSSISSCISNSSSTSSQLNSARSTDGGGSSRCSSFDASSVQSSLLLLPPADDVPGRHGAPVHHPTDSYSGPIPSAIPTNSSIVSSVITSDFHCMPASLGQSVAALSRMRSGEMSICSTSSEPGIPTDTTSLGSMTASPADVLSGDPTNL